MFSFNLVCFGVCVCIIRFLLCFVFLLIFYYIHIAQKWSLRLVKALIPKTTVPESAVMKAVSWMCTNKPPIVVQVSKFNAVIFIRDTLEC